jgi:hypothetical protein
LVQLDFNRTHIHLLRIVREFLSDPRELVSGPS